MISKAQVKHIRSLDDKKNRTEFQQFIVEGDKMCKELILSNYNILQIYATETWVQSNENILSHLQNKIVFTPQFDLQKISNFKSPQQVLAVVECSKQQEINVQNDIIILDNLQDPGNMGSIIRIADWYGVSQIICNTNTVDTYNPKVVQASMGSVFRVQCIYTNLFDFFTQYKNLETYACVMNGENLNHIKPTKNSAIIIGNESSGISKEIIDLAKNKITIPKKGEAESLNAAIACGIVCHTLLS